MVCQCHLPPSAAAAANYKQCVRIPNCHLCTFWYCFSWPPIPLLCMPHITKVNVPQHYNYQNTIQPHHALRLAFAFLKNVYIRRKKYGFNPVIWSPSMDINNSIFDSVCNHTLQLPLHINSDAHLFPIATCAHNQLCKGAHYVALHVLNIFQ